MIDNAKEILTTADIVSVIREFAPDIKLEKAGTNYKACCPFHSENTPSFSVSPAKNIYKCFGCNKGGDSAAFLMEHLNCTFSEALEKIAVVAKMKVHYREGIEPTKFKAEEKARKEKRDSLQAYFLNVLEYYQQHGGELPKSPENAELLEVAGRWYQKATVEKFGVFPPGPGTGLADYAAAQKWNFETLKELGLVNQSGSGNWYDVFQGRYLFLLKDHQGRPVGMAGRVPKDSTDKTAKYINSKGSELYNKSEVLFGFDLARKSIHNTETLYLTEGYTDVMTAVEHGLENVAATCGTALTDDHCRLMRRYGIKNVVLFRDGDRAGHEAAKKDVFTLIKNNLRPKVLLCDDGHDPDSQIRALNEKEFRGFREKEQDGIIWRVMLEWHKKDPALQSAALQVAAELLSYIDNAVERDIYKRSLTQPDTMGSVVKTLEKEIARYETARNPKNKRKNGLDSEENIDGMTYGVFKHENAYYRFDIEGSHTKISNFVINPQYLIKDKDQPRRIVEIVNIYGHVAILNVTTDIFGTMQKFRDEVARHGNFIFEPSAKAIDFNMIVKKVYDEMNDATGYQVVAMGWHHQGFYVWSNGITDLKGNFYEPDGYGLVNFDGTKFLLPGYGMTATDENFDHSEEDNAHIKAFRYYPGKCIEFSEWQRHFMGVYGENGMMGTAFWMASLFRDILFPVNKCFPLLNGFGKKGKGKSTMMWSIGYMFGDARLSGVLGVSTYTAFYRSFMQVSNAVVWWDEFHNKLDLKTWIKPMMGIWDGNGRSLGNIHSNTSTSTTPIRGAFAYTGQDMPVNNDGALLSRSIVLTYDYERTPEAEKKLRELRDIEQTGQLSQLTVNVLKHREKVERLWGITYDGCKNDLTDFLRGRMADMDKIESRTLINHLIPVTVYKILENDFEFGFTYLDLIAFTAKLVEQQANVIHSSDDTGQFWQVLEYLVNNNRLKHGKEILVEMTGKVTREKGRNESETEHFTDADGQPTERKVIFLRHKDAHMAYCEQLRSINKESLELPTLEHYLHTSKAFLGQCRAKKFGGASYRCLMFDASVLDGVEFLLTLEVKAYGDKDGDGDDLPENNKPKDPAF